MPELQRFFTLRTSDGDFVSVRKRPDKLVFAESPATPN